MLAETKTNPGQIPLYSLDEWDVFVENRYPDPDSITKDKGKNEYRDYRNTTRDCVKEFYRLNHWNQTFDFVKQKEEEFLGLNRTKMGAKYSNESDCLISMTSTRSRRTSQTQKN